MKRPLAYITAAWCGSDHENTKLAAQYCRTEKPLIRAPAKSKILREKEEQGSERSFRRMAETEMSGLCDDAVCGHTVTEAMKNDIAVAQRLGITATTLEGILTVKGQGRR